MPNSYAEGEGGRFLSINQNIDRIDEGPIVFPIPDEIPVREISRSFEEVMHIIEEAGNRNLNQEPAIPPQTRWETFQDNIEEAVEMILNPCEAIEEGTQQVQAGINDLYHAVTATLERYGLFAARQQPRSNDPAVEPLIRNEPSN